MKRILLAASFLAVTACGGSSPSLQVRPLDSGSLVDRVMNFQESMFALIAKSSSSDEAAGKVTAYCAENQSAIAQMQQEALAISETPDGETFNNQLAKRTEKLMGTVESALADKEAIMTDGKVLIAMAQCRGEGMMDAPAGDETNETPTDGAAPQPE